MLKYAQAANSCDEILRGAAEVLAQGRTAYQQYLFFRSPVHGVCVVLDGDLQSCEADEAVYHEALVHPAMLLHPDPRRVLIMGGGEGATAREVLRHGSVEEVVMVDIDREFVELCARLIPAWSGGAFADSRLQVRYQDINRYLAEGGGGFDVVIGDLVDVQDWDGVAAGLYGEDFYRRLRSRMNPGAVLATQAGALGGETGGHRRILGALGAAFAAAHSYGVMVPSFYHLWGFVVAGGGAPLIPPVAERGGLFARRCAERGVDLNGTGPDLLAAAFVLSSRTRAALASPA